MTLEEMEKRLKVLEDKEEIRELHYRYLNALTKVEWDKVFECFTEDVVTNIGIHGIKQGKPAVTSFFTNVIAKGHVGKEGNFVIHPIIKVDGDKAKASWLIYIMHLDAKGDKCQDWAQGLYDMEYARVNGQWKISYMGFQRRLGPPPPQTK
jgi:ketosteroid isomerase-like protein